MAPACAGGGGKAFEKERLLIWIQKILFTVDLALHNVDGIARLDLHGYGPTLESLHVCIISSIRFMNTAQDEDRINLHNELHASGAKHSTAEAREETTNGVPPSRPFCEETVFLLELLLISIIIKFGVPTVCFFFSLES